MSDCYGLVLAAGSSQRFGSDKRLHELPDGQPLALATLRVWVAALDQDLAHHQDQDGLTELFVVTRGTPEPAACAADPLVAHIEAAGLPVTLLTAPDSTLGMGHSLAKAIQNMPPGPVIIGLADMPFLQPATIKRIANRLKTAPTTAIVQPSYNTRPGNPVGFGTAHRGALSKSSGDAGARRVVKAAQHNHQIISLPVDDPGILRDIDTPSDLSQDVI